MKKTIAAKIAIRTPREMSPVAVSLFLSHVRELVDEIERATEGQGGVVVEFVAGAAPRPSTGVDKP